MSQDKSRDRFEAWAETEGYSTKTDNLGYCHPATNMAWRAWQASRAAVVVELPPVWVSEPNTAIGQACAQVRTADIKAIEAAGLKVAP